MQSEIHSGAEGETPEAPHETSMEGLLKQSSEALDKLKKKEIVYVRVVQIADGKVLVDIGEKHEAVVPLEDFSDGKPPAVDSRVPVVLERRGREDGHTVLSHKKARALLGWETLRKAFEAKQRVKGKVTQIIKGGYIVDVDGVQAFLPLSQSELRGTHKATLAVGAGVRCRIIELSEDKRQLVISRRSVLEEEETERKKKLLEALKVNDVRRGWISRAGELGVFVNLGGLEGLVKLEDVAWREPGKAVAALKRGEHVKVVVLKIDAEAGKVELGIKQLTPNPAEALKRRFPPRTIVSGKVESVAPEGAKLTIKDGVPATIPASEFGVKPPKAGEVVKAVVIGVSPSTFEVTLSARRHEDIEDRKRVASYMKTPPPLTLGQLLSGGEDERRS